MFATELKFSQVLKWFRENSHFEYMMLFVSSFDEIDREVIDRVIDESYRIDNITGNSICYFLFDRFAILDKKDNNATSDLIHHISEVNVNDPNIPYKATVQTANDICDYFHIMRHKLPAFIFIPRNSDEYCLKSIKKPDDIECILSPIRIANQYYEDMEKCSAKDEYDEIKHIYAKRLNEQRLDVDDLSIIKLLDNKSLLLKKIFECISEREDITNELIDKFKKNIKDKRFDTFISCKSKDYEKAHELYDFLQDNGLRPFIADISIRQIGEDRYGDLIRQVIDMSKNLIVYTSNIDYMSTPYVSSEWNLFLDELTAGRKDDGRLLSIIPDGADIRSLPIGLRNRQFFYISTYKDVLLDFLK
jgi:hypothetical protein